MLTDKECRAAKAGPKPVKLFDGHGLHLLISTTGHKSWRLKYRVGGKEKQIAFGAYPAVRLSEARMLSAAARKTLQDGADPALEFGKKAKKRQLATDATMTFESVATKWHSEQKSNWKPRYAQEVISSLKRDVFPDLGQMDVRKIRAKNVREVLQAVQARGALETAYRILQRIESVYEYAISEELAEIDPTTGVVPSLKKVLKRRQPAVLSIPRAQAFLKAYEATPGHPGTKLASRLLALTAARPGMIQLAEVNEFHGLDGPEPVWTVPAEKMKLRLAESEEEAFDFTMPLSRQAVAVVKAALGLAGKRKHLFPSARHSKRPITSNALNVAYRRVGGWEGQHVPHGWRATFSTIMNERAATAERDSDRKIIDLMLAHVPSGVEGRYNRAAYMPRRRQIAQEWADLLCEGLASLESLLELPRH
ncbi:tyrosine-type recombinase/integrase [Novosphingobium humi]|uniref:tyrosine-type recombinase/integrase n=1 Tax=Novosphingobium humi TaxID=2282397 RepID=UPI0025AF1939|nr:integrase arm-type DNA-binding domain-containing protein [Novosphingobium humi]WJS97812.1 integrase arm-type DNA-binding domain-containing protein [Novosphingobium humi]